MSRKATRAEEAAARATRKVASRAVRRLDVLEWVLLAATAGLATLGGALVAALVAAPLGVSFRTAWVVASVLMFAVPGALALRKMRQEDRALREKLSTENDGSHG